MSSISSIDTTSTSFYRYIASLTPEEVEEHCASLSEQEKSKFRAQCQLCKLIYSLKPMQRAEMNALLESEMARMDEMDHL
jgi:DNA-directed RNA polymerase subunit F